MIRMVKGGGYHNAVDQVQAEQMVADGWEVITDEAWTAILAKKRGAVVATPEEPATIEAHEPKRRGRPRLSVPSFLSGAEDGNSPNDN